MIYNQLKTYLLKHWDFLFFVILIWNKPLRLRGYPNRQAKEYQLDSNRQKRLSAIAQICRRSLNKVRHNALFVFPIFRKHHRTNQPLLLQTAAHFFFFDETPSTSIITVIFTQQ